MSKMTVRKFDGANMDIDLTSNNKNIGWNQETCPWNKYKKTYKHKCAEKNTFICPYFCGIEYLDNVLCCYPCKFQLKSLPFLSKIPVEKFTTNISNFASIFWFH